jgi:hypothetical protein
MRATRLGVILALTLAIACRSGRSVPEEGSALIRVSCTDGVSTSDELRVWAYDDKGMLWDGARVPEQGALASKSSTNLGTILIAPGAIQGALRIHVRAFAAGNRLADGMLSIPSLTGSERTYDLRLEPTVPTDSDGDDVPDGIDDCPDVANPSQGGCPGGAKPDAGSRTPDSGERPADTRAPSSVTDGEVATNPDTNAVVGVDAKIDPKNTDGSTSVQADTQVNVDTKISVFADAPPADRPIDAFSNTPDTKVVNPDTNTVAVDSAIPDRVPPTPDSAVPDVPEEDACGSNCKKAQGAQCGNNSECASGACADGVCCTNACVGACRSCNQPNAVGSCQGYAPGSDPEGECLGGACNGAGACGAAPPTNRANGQLCKAGTECASGHCADGVCCNEACNLACQACGTGTCASVTNAEDNPECMGTKICNPRGKCVTKNTGI